METDGLRPTWDQTWLFVARAVAGRSRCVRSQVGAVVVSPDQRVQATGYNGPASSMELTGLCSSWCPRASGEAPVGNYFTCPSIHAEMNALLRADSKKIEGGTLYVTRAPCMDCAKVVSNSGVTRVICARPETEDPYWDEVSDYMNLCKIEMRYIG